MDTKKLTDVLNYIKKDKARIIFIKRDINESFKRNYGFTTSKMIEMVRLLSERDYIEGPSPDDDLKRDGWIYKFKRTYYECGECYIKIKVIDDGRPIIVISFHENR